MYHRVAELETDPWEIAVHPKNFEQQLQFLKNRFHVITVSELVQHVKNKAIPKNCICVTFDDGYCDNYVHAKPLLEKYQCPATFFIASAYINCQQPFWWDALQYLILDTPVLPTQLSIVLNEELIDFPLYDECLLTEKVKQMQMQWVAPENPPTKRCELYLLLWKKLKPLFDKNIQLALDNLRACLNNTPVLTNELSLPLSRMQLQDMARHPLFDIGLHTNTHPCLSFHTKGAQNDEVVNNARSLKAICKGYKNIITYPYGDYNQITLDVVKNAKLEGAFTTREKIVTRNVDRYCLGRFQVKNWNGPAFEQQLAVWLKSY